MFLLIKNCIHNFSGDAVQPSHLISWNFWRRYLTPSWINIKTGHYCGFMMPRWKIIGMYFLFSHLQLPQYNTPSQSHSQSWWQGTLQEMPSIYHYNYFIFPLFQILCEKASSSLPRHFYITRNMCLSLSLDIYRYYTMCYCGGLSIAEIAPNFFFPA